MTLTFFDHIAHIAPVLESSHDNLWLCDAASGRLWLSQSCRTFVDLTDDEELHFDEFRDRIHEDDRTAWVFAVNDCIQGVQPEFDIEMQLNGSQGQYRWVRAGGRVIEHGEDAERYLVGWFRDITQEKRTRDFYETVVRTLPCYVFVKDTSLRFTYANEALSETIGLSKDDIIGCKDEELFPDNTEVDQFRKADEAVLRQERPFDVEIERLTCPSGNVVSLKTRKVPLELDGQIVGILGVSTNITELDLEKRFLEKVMHCVGDGIILSTVEGEVVRSNRLAEMAMELSRGSASDSLQENAAKEVRQVSVDAIDFPLIELEENGETRWFLVRKFPWEGADGGGVEGYISILKDVTKLKRTERLLEDRKRLLEVVLDRIPQVISLKDKAGRYVLANAAAARLIGFRNTAVLIGRTDEELCDETSGLTPELAASWREIESKVIGQDVAVTTEESIGCGEYRTLLWRVPFRDAEGSVAGVLTISGS